MRAQSDDDDDLATSLPPSLTVDLQLPEPVREAPPEEVVVALDAVAVRPVAAEETPGTTSIAVPADAVLEPARTAEEAVAPVAEPAEVVPLPALEAAVVEPAPARERPARRERPAKPGRRPAPEGFWPELLYTGTLHLANVGDSRRVRARKALDARIGAPVGGTARFVPVLGRKGGIGTTTIATLLGMALADVRGDDVLAIDAHPDRGTLADRVAKQTLSTVRDLVLHAPELRTREAIAEHLSRDATGLAVVASDADPLVASAFDDGGYHVVAELVAAHFGVVVSDTGSGVVHPVVRAALQRADVAVVVSGGGLDEARLASETLTWLEANGHGDLVENAVVALNASTQGTDLDKLADIERHFRSRVRAVVRIPYDPALSAGSVVRFAALRPFTRDSARDLAAAVMDGVGPSAGERE